MAAHANTDRELYSPFASLESVVVDAYDYLHDRPAPVPFRLGCAMVESFHAWEADMQEMHPDVLAGHEVTPSWSPAPVDDDLMSSDALPMEAEFATNHLHANNARVPKDVLRRLMASAEAVGPQRPDR